jgi:hypothetical protein
MAKVRSVSGGSGGGTADEALPAAATRLIARAEAMGLLGEREPGTGYDRRLLATALDAFARAGIGRRVGPGARTGADLSPALELLEDDVEHSPLPRHEWGSMLRVLGPDLLGRLVGVSPSSIRRYTAGSRRTPDPVAARLHWLALVVADLAGSYTDVGVRRWFERPRTPLAGRSPAEVLGPAWNPDEPEVEAVRALAEALTAPLAT